MTHSRGSGAAGCGAAQCDLDGQAIWHCAHLVGRRRRRAAFAQQAAAAGIDLPETALDDAEDWGKPESVITAAVDVTPYLEYKRRAMRAHASQISEASFFLALPDEAFRYGFGTEWFIRDGQGPGITETDLLAGL